MPTAESDCMARSRQLSSMPRNLSARRKFSSTVYQGSSVLSWNTNAMSLGRGRSTGLPATVTAPAIGCSIPPMMLSSVLLPQPEGPSRQTNSPLRMSTETSSSACTLCAASRPVKTIDTWSTAMVGTAAAPAAASRMDMIAASVRWRSAVTSELHRHELVVVDRLRLRDEVQDSQVLQRFPDDVDGHRVPRAVGREAADLGVVDLRHDALAHLDHPGTGFHRGGLVGLHEGDGLEPAAQEAPQQLRPLLDHLVGGVDDVRVEMLLDVAEQEDVASLALLLELERGRRLDHQPVELVALHGGETGGHRAERHDLNSVGPPALLPGELARQPVGERSERGDADALSFQIGDRLD